MFEPISECSTYDDDVTCVQRSLKPGDNDPVMTFGPLSAPLSTLFDMGYQLSATCYRLKRQTNYAEKLHLYKGREKWKVGSVPRRWFINQEGSLSNFVNNKNYLLKGSLDIERDPFKQIERMFPRKRPKDIQMGNQTLREYIRSL